MWKGNHLSIKGYTKGVNENVWAEHGGGGGRRRGGTFLVRNFVECPVPPGWKTWGRWCGLTNKTPVLPNHDDKFLFATVGLNAIFRGQSYRWRKKPCFLEMSCLWHCESTRLRISGIKMLIRLSRWQLTSVGLKQAPMIMYITKLI